MKFAPDQWRAAEAAVYLISKKGSAMNYMALVKLLYLADREALLRAGKPITGASPCAMKNGMVLSEVLDWVKAAPKGSVWRDHISYPVNYDVAVTAPMLGASHLSIFEREILDEVFSRFGSLTQFQLGELTHELKEYQDPGNSSKMIDHSDILRSEGKSENDISAIDGQASADRLLTEIVGA